MNMNSIFKKSLVLLLSVACIPVLASCHLKNNPKENIPSEPPAEVTLPTSLSAPTTTPTTTTTAPTTTKPKKIFGQVTADLLNMRKAASTDSDILSRLKKGEEVEVLGRSNGFYKVRYKDQEGFCSEEYIKLTRSSAGAEANSENTESTLENSEPTQSNSDQ